MSNLTKENAGKVFGQGMAKEFFAKSGTKIIANKRAREADAQKSYIANKILSNGGKGWAAGLHAAEADKSLYANKAQSKGMVLGSGMQKSVSAELAARVVEKAEQETALQQAVLKQMAGMEK